MCHPFKHIHKNRKLKIKVGLHQKNSYPVDLHSKTQSLKAKDIISIKARLQAEENTSISANDESGFHHVTPKIQHIYRGFKSKAFFMYLKSLKKN
jgi:hypothetical protein